MVARLGQERIRGTAQFPQTYPFVGKLARRDACAGMFEKLCAGIDKAMLEGPETGSGFDVMPPRLTY